MAKQVKVAQFDKRMVADWARPLVTEGYPYSAGNALELYLEWAQARGWRLSALTAMGPEFFVVWEGEDTTGSPDPWESE